MTNTSIEVGLSFKVEDGKLYSKVIGTKAKDENEWQQTSDELSVGRFLEVLEVLKECEMMEV